MMDGLGLTAAKSKVTYKGIKDYVLVGSARRTEKVRARKVEPNIDNMPKITNDGRKLALGQRLVDLMLPDDATGEVNSCIDNVYPYLGRTRRHQGNAACFL